MAPPLTTPEKMLCVPVLMVGMTAGVGEEAQQFDQQLYSIKQSVELAVSFSSQRDQCLQELAETVEECSDEDWDGYGAASVQQEAVKRAGLFIHALPTDSPYPEVGAMPDGEVSLDWDLGARRTLTVSIGAYQRIAYAMISGDEERSGTLSFIHEVPESLLHVINELHRLG